jgi:hypothetical protein
MNIIKFILTVAAVFFTCVFILAVKDDRETLQTISVVLACLFWGLSQSIIF